MRSVCCTPALIAPNSRLRRPRNREATAAATPSTAPRRVAAARRAGLGRPRGSDRLGPRPRPPPAGGRLLRLGARYRGPRPISPTPAGRSATTRSRVASRRSWCAHGHSSTRRRVGAARCSPTWRRLLARDRRAAEAPDRGVAADAPPRAARRTPGARRSLRRRRPRAGGLPGRLGPAPPGPDPARRGRARRRLDRILVNNIQVTFIAYAGGITLGLVTGYVLATNGILLGAVAGLATGGERWRPAAPDRRARRAELSCIAVTAAAGRASAGRSSSPGRARGPRRCAPRPGARSGSCSGRCRGSCSRARGGLRHRHVLARRRAAARDRARRARLGLVLVLGRDPARVSAQRARAYALTQAPAKRSARLHDDGAAARARPRARGPAASRAPRTSRRRRAARRRPREQAVERLVATLATHTERRGHGHGATQRARRGVVDEIDEHETNARQPTLRRLSRSRAVGVHGLDVEERARDSGGAEPRGPTSRSTRSAKAIAPLRSRAHRRWRRRRRGRRARRRAACRRRRLRRSAGRRRAGSAPRGPGRCGTGSNIGRPSRAVARQLICRTSSSGAYSRTASNAVPRP